MRTLEIWSGGQTGVDRAAWDAARAAGLRTAGWVPGGRLAEDGAIPDIYTDVQETPSSDYAERTTWNIRDSDATLILYRNTLAGGSLFTRTEAERLGRPVLAVDLDAESETEVIRRVCRWLSGISGTRLNVAGPRASGDPAIYHLARGLIAAVLATCAESGSAP
jgi:Circularly permutated YpsA SLOG family